MCLDDQCVLQCLYLQVAGHTASVEVAGHPRCIPCLSSVPEELLMHLHHIIAVSELCLHTSNITHVGTQRSRNVLRVIYNVGFAALALVGVPLLASGLTLHCVCEQDFMHSVRT